MQVTHEKMIDLCAQCDADWGHRLAEGLKKAASGQAGATQANEAKALEAVKQAEEMAHDAKPY